MEEDNQHLHFAGADSLLNGENMSKKLTEKETRDALLKSATGFVSSDVVEEFSLDDSGEMKLIKRKITKKEYPPNISALKTLAEISIKEDELESMNDVELESERQRMLGILAKMETGEEKNETEEE